MTTDATPIPVVLRTAPKLARPCGHCSRRTRGRDDDGAPQCPPGLGCGVGLPPRPSTVRGPGCVRAVDETGRRYGDRVVVRRVPGPSKRVDRGAYWLCRCDCGIRACRREVVVAGYDLRAGLRWSCKHTPRWVASRGGSTVVERGRCGDPGSVGARDCRGAVACRDRKRRGPNKRAA